MASRASKAWRSTSKLERAREQPSANARLFLFIQTKSGMHINLLHLGAFPYAEAMAIQQQVVAARKQDLIGDTLLLLEHPPVFTLGRNAHRSNILASDEFLANRGVRIARGESRRRRNLPRPRSARRISHPRPPRRPPGKERPVLGTRRLRPPARRGSDPHLRRLRRDDPAHLQAHRRLDHGRRQHPGKEDRRHRSSRLAGHHLPRLRIERHDRPSRLRLDRPLRHHRSRQVTSLELEAGADRQPTMEPALNATARNFGRVFERQMLWCESVDQTAGRPTSEPRHGQAVRLPHRSRRQTQRPPYNPKGYAPRRIRPECAGFWPSVSVV